MGWLRALRSLRPSESCFLELSHAAKAMDSLDWEDRKVGWWSPIRVAESRRLITVDL